MIDHEARPSIRVIDTAQTLPLRLAVLRPGGPIETARFPGDEEPTTRHFGAFRGEQLLAIASLFRVEMPELPGQPAYQLRGMATSPKAQRTGLGRLLLDACITHARQNGAAILWCNARTSAAGFYAKAGFQTLGLEFTIPDVGPHFRMCLKLNAE